MIPGVMSTSARVHLEEFSKENSTNKSRGASILRDRYANFFCGDLSSPLAEEDDSGENCTEHEGFEVKS